MASLVSNILHRSTRGNRKLNILCGATHERYQTGLAQTNCNFYLFKGEHIKDWNTKFAPLPDNHIMLHGKDIQQLSADISFDAILSQHKFGQFQIFAQLAHMLHVPLISLEHTLPMNSWHKNALTELKAMKGDINLFISEYSRNKWGWNENEADVIHHGIDTELFKPTDIERTNHVLSVVNDWVARQWCCNFNGWQRITQGLPVHPVGDTPGLSQPAKDVNELVKEYQSSQVFINTSTISPIPTSLLEAMSCGCAVVSTATCMIPEVIEDGVNGFISNDESVLRDRLNLLLNDKDLARKMGEKARETIVSKLSMDKFVASWNAVFDKASGIPFRGC